MTHLFRGHGGPVSALHFYFSPDESRMELLTGSTDSRVRLYDLRDPSARGGSVKPNAVLEGHVSVVRGIDVSPDGRWAITGSRDKVILVWDLAANQPGSSQKGGRGKGGGPKVVQTIIAQEQVEALGLLPSNPEDRVIRCYSGGDKGHIRIWNVMTGEQLGSMKGVEGLDEVEAEEDEQRGIINILCVHSFLHM